MTTPAAAVLFDLDGTLIDTASDIAHAANAMLAALHRPPYDEVTVKGWIGDGIARLIKRALTGTRDGEPDAALFAAAQTIFGDRYEAVIAEQSRPYPHAQATLASLRAAGFRLACITNKAARFTEPLLVAVGLREYFDVVLSGDSVLRTKPDPLPLTMGCERLGVSPAGAVVVGDSANDLRAARAAAMAAIAVSYGYHHGVDLVALGPVAVVDDLAAVPGLLQYDSGFVRPRAMP
ncbi:MAG: phosphoglycolate phosphatase [Acidiferrobacter sp.]